MQRNVLRALLLAMAVLIVGALPAAAQSDEGWLLTGEDDNVIIASKRDVVVPAGDSVDGLAIFNGDARIDGEVKNLFAVDSDVVVGGPSGKVETTFTIGGTLTADDDASLVDVYYIETDTFGVTGASVEGEFINAQEEVVGAIAAIIAVLIILLLFVVIGAFIAMLAMTLLVVAFGTEQTRRAAATISNDVLKTIVVGLLMMIIPNIVFVLLFVTIVGIPLALGLMILWGFVAFLGWIVVSVWIGERILPRARTAARPYGAAFLGMLILILLSWTGIVPLLVGIFGTGAVTLAGWRVLRGGGMPPVPPGYGGMPYGQPLQVPPPQYAPPPYAPPPYVPPPAQQGGQNQWPPQDQQPPGAWPQG